MTTRADLEAALRRAERSDEGRALGWLADVLAVLIARRWPPPAEGPDGD